jgi:hypothetical protein
LIEWNTELLLSIFLVPAIAGVVTYCIYRRAIHPLGKACLASIMIGVVNTFLEVDTAAIWSFADIMTTVILILLATSLPILLYNLRSKSRSHQQPRIER